MRKRKSRSSVSTVNKIIDKMESLWMCIFYLSIILTVTTSASPATEAFSTSSTRTGSSSAGTTQEYKRSVTEQSMPLEKYALTNISQVLNVTSEGRAANRLFIRSGNELWDGLVDDCLYKPSFSCFQKNVFLYLDKTLKLDDLNITDRILFKKIDVNASRIADELAAENEIPVDDEGEQRSGK